MNSLWFIISPSLSSSFHPQHPKRVFSRAKAFSSGLLQLTDFFSFMDCAFRVTLRTLHLALGPEYSVSSKSFTLYTEVYDPL